MQTVVLFYTNGETEIIQENNGIEFKVSELNESNVEALFVAKSKPDAEAAIQVLGKGKIKA